VSATTAARAAAAAVVAAALVVSNAGCLRRSGPRPEPATTQQATPAPAPAGPVVAKVGDLLGSRPLFGVTISDRSEAAVARVGSTIGCRPSLLQMFASVEDGISAETLREVPGLPVLSLEPWRTGGGPDQPNWSLAATIDGRWDDRYAAVAAAIVAYRDPVLIRFAHEMNGHWYPWGTANGNKPGQFVAAWRHVVELFRDAGATNALWVWSPNILRGADSQTVKEFWPGKAYVDILGLTGYGVRETSPTKTYRATLKQVYALSDKPILLTEVGVQAGPAKKAWLGAFGPWLRDNPRIAGFLWNEITRDGDWRYDDTPQNLAAFKSGLFVARLRC
jgi:hypothetical protein